MSNKTNHKMARREFTVRTQISITDRNSSVLPSASSPTRAAPVPHQWSPHPRRRSRAMKQQEWISSSRSDWAAQTVDEGN